MNAVPHPASTVRDGRRPPLLTVERLVKHYDSRRGLWGTLTGKSGALVQAVNGVSLAVERGETLGIIGESGCGKSTLGRTILRLHEPTSGRILFDNTDITTLGHDEMLKLRRRMQIVFQDPYASLNPRKTVLDILGGALRIHGIGRSADLKDRVVAMLESVGLRASHVGRYPHQFSGGQRQRIGIARALILHPEFVVCDEPVSALDVSIQAQIIQLLSDLKRELGLTYLFISHDIAVIGYVSDRIAVMYLGEIVEQGPVQRILEAPRHPYTQALLSAVPRVDKTSARKRITLAGDLPSPLAPPTGCKFHTRCPLAKEICRRQAPPVVDLGGRQSAACHLLTEAA